ncbi:MAG: M28 family peptidase, partial [Bacteroidia bacterium]|nr:M28 family peptidase [Bacteroidia bacterium]
HPWAKDVGLVLNFEARGSGGPSYMLIETNGGNANMIREFKEANPDYPVANSLAYSIYKMLPNDTDLTVFRRDGNIEGFNFAFIDDHYDYHTANDSYDRLDRNSLEHQGSYLMPLLHHFSEANLNNLKSQDDDIYVNMPILGMVAYPFAWIFPMLIIVVLLFVGLLYYGIHKRKLNSLKILQGFIPLLISLFSVIVIGYVLWELLKSLYPEYAEMEHGFTYNGHTYIAAFIMLALAICLWVYHKFYNPKNAANLLIAPLVLWLAILALVAFNLQGASFLIIPVGFGLLSLFVLMRQKEPSLVLMALLAFPMLFIMAPMLKMLPVGLGFFMGDSDGIQFSMKIVSMVLVVLMFGLMVPVFGFFRHKNRWALGVLVISIILLLSANFNSNFTEENPKPNSLVYSWNADDDSAIWATYDNMLDDWTMNYLGDDPDQVNNGSENFASKYGSGYTFTKKAIVKPISAPYVDVKSDTVIGDFRHINLYISPQRPVNRMELFADRSVIFKDFNINGVDVYKKNKDANAFNNRWRNRLFSFYVSDNDPLILEFSVPKDQKTVMTLYEASFDLLTNPLFTVPKRQDNMMPKPFVLNDAVLVKKTITID